MFLSFLLLAIILFFLDLILIFYRFFSSPLFKAAFNDFFVVFIIIYSLHQHMNFSLIEDASFERSQLIRLSVSGSDYENFSRNKYDFSFKITSLWVKEEFFASWPFITYMLIIFTTKSVC